MFGRFRYGVSKTAGAAFLLTVMLLVLGPGNTLWAESDKDTGSGKTQALGSIIVTANKVEEDIKDVPQSITVIDDSMLKEKQVKNIPDLVSQIPNMTFTTNHGKNITFRGLAPSLLTYNNPVVIYIDGVAYTNGFGFDASLVNVDRIEVLRGPQGTLYGKDAYGGVINIITKDPGEQWRGQTSFEYGSFNYMEGAANISGPLLKERLYLGINGRYTQDDGWIENNYPGMDDDANKGKAHNINTYLLYKPTDRLKARLSVTQDYSENNWIDGYALAGGTDLSAFSRDDSENVRFDMPHVEEATNLTQSLNLAYRFDPVTLTAITSHRRIDIENDYDADYMDNSSWLGLKGFLYSETDTWTQELRLASNNRVGLRWISGVYFDYETIERDPYGTEAYAYSSLWEMNYLADVKNTTQTVFGQVMMPFGKGFELTLGGRYQNFHTDIDLKTYYQLLGTNGSPYLQYEGEKSWTAFLPKAALSYKISDAWTTYTSWSKGYMPGGYNMVAIQGSAGENSFEPQRSTNYEVGIKGQFDRLRLAAALFYMDIEDIHIYKYLNAYTYVTDNADSAHSKGAEIEVSYFPTDNIEVSLALGFIDAVYDSYNEGNGVTYDGEKIQATPDYTANLGLAYYHPDGFYMRTDLRGQGDTSYLDDVNKKLSEEGAYMVWDMKVGYRFGDNLDIYLYGRNLTNEAYITSFKSMSTVSVATFGDPRIFGIGLRYYF